MNDKYLLVSGGIGSSRNQELVPLDGNVITSSLPSPVDYGSCIIQLTKSSILITGGTPGNSVHTRDTWFQYFDERNKQELGPKMLTERMVHACGKLDINGDTVLIVAGGRKGVDPHEYLDTSEYLNMNSINLAWKNGTLLRILTNVYKSK